MQDERKVIAGSRVFTTAGDPDAVGWIRVKDIADPTRVIDQLRPCGGSAGHVDGQVQQLIAPQRAV